jgi:hypothetical protein
MSASISIPLIAAAVSTSALRSFFQAAGRKRDGLLEAFDPKLPEDVAIAGVDGEQWTVAVGALHERTRDAVVMLHDESENSVDIVNAFEDWLLICAVPVPDDWKPVVGTDEFGTDQQTGDKAVKLFEQHRFLAEGEQFLVKLLDATRQT